MFIPYDLSRLNILIAEHHEYMRKTMQGIMRSFNIANVRVVGSVEDAQSVLMMGAHDVLFTDWSPNMDGLALVDWVRKNPDSPTPFLPVVMVSAFAERRHVLTARDWGAKEYIVKPVSAHLVHSRLVSIVESNRSFVRTEQFFGPDRRRKSKEIDGKDRRNAANAA